MIASTFAALRCPGRTSLGARAAHTQPVRPSGIENRNDSPSENTSRPMLEIAQTSAATARPFVPC